MINKRSLGLMSVTLINVAAVSSLRNLPIMANCGLHLLFFYGLAAVCFFIPTALIAAELATTYSDNNGGVYTWVREAMGPKWGFVAAWALVAKGFVYFPSVLAFVAGSLAFLINPELIENRYYTLAIMLGAFWAGTLVNYKGLKLSDKITSIGSIVGTIVPGVLIVGLGVYWLLSNNPSEISITDKTDFFPTLSEFGQLTFLAGTFVGFAGMELSAAHAKDIANPKRTYPMAILISAILILCIFVMGSLAIALVVPQDKLSLDAGIMQAFANIFKVFNMGWITPLIALLVVGGAIATLKTWIISPIQKLHATSEYGAIPPYLQKTNKYGIPMRLLTLQAIVVSVFSSVFLFMPSVNSAFWLLTALTASSYMVVFLLMFPAAIILRFKQPNRPRPYKVPGGNITMVLVGGIGFFSTLFAFTIAFVPPSNLPMGNVVFSVTLQIVSCILLFTPPLIFFKMKKDSWIPKQVTNAPQKIAASTPSEEKILVNTR